MYRITYRDSNDWEQIYWVEAQDPAEAEKLFRNSHSEWEVRRIVQIIQKHS